MCGVAGELVIGIGARRGAGGDDLRAAVEQVLADAAILKTAVGVLATVDRRAGDPGVRNLAFDCGWRLVSLAAAELARQEVPHPSRTVAAAVGTPSVAEAAALCAAGAGSVLVVTKRVFPAVTVAVARGALL
jgi:cobalt-precorrin 5A hydrolase